jgi:peptidyl-prolyl cis-trans isomerase A (cyclophilin A)
MPGLRQNFLKFLLIAMIPVLVTCARKAQAQTAFDNTAGSVYRINTTQGSINLRMTDSSTPLTVANFGAYQSDASWSNTFVHRSIAGFVVQLGGFQAASGLPHITAKPAVQNEYGISNTRGTVAMAKVGGDPNSATSEFFFNLGDNSSNLDNQNGGFTVFAHVIGTDMTIVDQIAALKTVSLGSTTAFTDLPVQNWDGTSQLTFANLVTVTSVDKIAAFQNPINKFDVDHSGSPVALDALLVINDINANGNHAMSSAYTANANYLDVSGDGLVTPLDALQIINYLNSLPVNGTPLTPLSLTVSVVPEPATVTLVAFGAVALGAFVVRRQRS